MDYVQTDISDREKVLAWYKMPGPYTDDIIEHLDYLTELAKGCEHVTEMGFRVGTSFSAFLAANPKKLVTYDIVIPDGLPEMFQAIRGDTELEFHQKSTLEVEIEPTDLLFVDTLHVYQQLKKELALHGNKARKYLAFHDTVSYGEQGEDKTKPGLLAAIKEFLVSNSGWIIKDHRQNNNGLMVLERVN